MDCQKFERLIVLSLEGELNPRQKTGLEKHLESCSQCRELLDEYRTLRQTLVQLSPEPVPVLPTAGQLMCKKEKSPFRRILRRSILTPIALTVCLLLVFGFMKTRSTFLVNQNKSSETNLLSDVSEQEFFDVNFPHSSDYHYFIEKLSTDEQETFLDALQKM